jgi:hypothetical protein
MQLGGHGRTEPYLVTYLDVDKIDVIASFAELRIKLNNETLSLSTMSN